MWHVSMLLNSNHTLPNIPLGAKLPQVHNKCSRGALRMLMQVVSERTRNALTDVGRESMAKNKRIPFSAQKIAGVFVLLVSVSLYLSTSLDFCLALWLSLPYHCLSCLTSDDSILRACIVWPGAVPIIWDALAHFIPRIAYNCE